MPPSPDADPNAPTNSPLPPTNQRSFPWFWFGTFLGTVFSAAGLALAAWAWVFIQEDLSPLISKTLTNSLDRPVALGDVEKVTLSSIQVGPSELGASTKDATTVTAQTVRVNFNLLETLLTSELGLDLALTDAEGYLEQDSEKGWLNFATPEREETTEERFKVRVDNVRIQDTQLTLVPLPAEDAEPDPIVIEQVKGSLSIDPVTVAEKDSNRIRFDVDGNPIDGGDIAVKGEVEPILVVESALETPDETASKPDQSSSGTLEPETLSPDSSDEKDPELDFPKLDFATNLSIRSEDAPLADILSFTLSTIGIPTDEVTVTSGEVSGSMDMEIRPNNKVDYSGAIQAKNTDIETTILPLPIENAKGSTRFQGNKWTVDTLTGSYGEIDAVAKGLIDFDNGYDLSAVTKNVTVEEFTNTIKLALPVPTTGNFDAVAYMTGPIEQPEFSGSATAVEPLQVDRVTFTSASTDFLLQGQQLYLDDIAGTPSTGGSLRGSGEVRLSDSAPFTFNLAGRSLPARELAQLYDLNPGVKLGLVSADASVVGNSKDVNTTIDWNAPAAEYPGRGTVGIANGTDLTFRDTVFQLAGGTVSGSGTLINGLWTADASLANVDLNQISPDLVGDVGGQFQFSGSTADTRISAIAGSGNIAFSNGLATFNPEFARFNEPLTGQVVWNGEKIAVLQSQSERLTATGTITPLFDKGFDGLERFDLNITARDYDINDIPFVEIPDIFQLAGRADFTGTLTGKPELPSINGTVQASNLVVNTLPFNQQLTGTVSFTPESGLALNAAGPTDKIALNIGPFLDAGNPNAPFPDLNFDVDWRDTFARGQSQGDFLTLTAGNFPLSALNFPPPGTGADIGQLRGTLTSADAVVNLANESLEGDIVVERLGLGYIGAGKLAGKVRFADSLATLTGGELQLNENSYTVNGRVAIDGPEPVYSADIQTAGGDIQGILTALSIYQLEDFRRGLTPPEWIADPLSQSELDTFLATNRTGDPNTALLNQLRRLAEIQALQEQAAIAQASQPLPPLQELQGPFAGNFQLNGTGGDFQLDFDLGGSNWTWGEDYSAQQVIAKGSVTPNIITFEPVRLASVIAIPPADSPESASVDPSALNSTDPMLAEQPVNTNTNTDPTPIAVIPPTEDISPTVIDEELAAINLSGQIVFGSDTELTSNLQAKAQNLNISALGNILQLPLDIDGFANATATLGGTLANPQLRGLTELENATINDTPIQAASAQFIYQNARLGLTSALTATAPEHPLSLSAQIPYAFNFMEIQPDSDDISVTLNVQDEGLALLNIFNQQVAWESGSGQFNIEVGGTLASPELEGFANLEDAVLSAEILPEPLTNVAGRATFIGDRIIVETLQGSFSEGQLTAAGTFPLLYPIVSGNQLTALTTPQSEPQSTEQVPITAPTEEIQTETQAPVAAPAEAVPPSEPPAADTNLLAITEDPLFRQPLAADRPLTVNLQNIDLTLEDLYSGGVNGQIVMGGSALLNGPQVGGEVVLSQGQVLLPDGNGDAANVSADGTIEAAAEAAENPANDESIIVPQFRDLRLTLGNSIRVVQGSLLNFVADGTLILNGPPTALEPDGTINLRSGRVNLFTTLFRLRGSDNTAEFTPEMGLDNPLLDVSLRASVPEVDSRGPVASTPFFNAEIADESDSGFDNPGSLRTIRVRADVEGPANALFENLELSSSPSRTQNELVGLIGGSFVTALESTVGSLSGNGDSFEGLINLVSGTILTRVQDLVGNTFSLSEFNLFPVTSASRERSDESRGTGLDIGASIGFDVTNDTSLSVSKILTDSSNPEFGASYRLTDALTVRGATNFRDINQVLLEYELRF